MKLNCVVVDDEPLAIRILEKYIDRIPQLALIGTCEDALPAIRMVKEESVDLLFLDINMPTMSGTNLIRTLANPPMVVFTTAHPEYAVEGFELKALDYLVKPISFERFLKAVNRALDETEVRNKRTSSTIPSSADALMFRADKKLHRIPFEKILYVQAYGDYVRLYTKDGHFITKNTLQNLESRLPDNQFLRVHRSYIVSVPAIRYLEGNHLRVSETDIPIGQTYKELIIDKLNKG